MFLSLHPGSCWREVRSPSPLTPIIPAGEVSKELTWQRADEFIDIFYIPLCGLTW